MSGNFGTVVDEIKLGVSETIESVREHLGPVSSWKFWAKMGVFLGIVGLAFWLIGHYAHKDNE